MRIVAYTILISFISSSGLAQEIKEKSYLVPGRVYPSIPSQDSLIALCKINYNDIERIVNEEPKKVRKYFLDGKLFSGWAYQIFADNNHRYRYTHYIDGLLMRQIAFYEDGSIDLDFNMKEGLEFGCQRMWMEDGNPYINSYYSAPGVQQGIQLAWHRNGKLSRKASYNRGTLLYDYKYDMNGQIVSK